MARTTPPFRSFPLALLATLAACGTSVPAGPDLTSPPASQHERMAWWRDARFGMFLHWGLYAIPAGKWQDRSSHGEWIRDTARIPLRVYEQFQPNWNPAKFDANAWAAMAAAAGMKYVVITSKHHDGFCLWDSAQTDWDVGNTHGRRDILGELAAACRKRGIVFCTYHSIMDWHHPDYLPRRPWETDRPTAGADFDRFERYLHAQVSEVITRYQPGVMWFDGEWENTWNHERGVRLYDLCRRLAPGMIVNNRVDVHRGGMAGFSNATEAVGDFATPEQEIPATGLPGVDWESCMTMNSHWGWNAADTKWKSTTELVRNLIDIASKGGNYLLNIGPRADGTFPPEAVERLAAIGAWMKANGEAIHGTTASVFDDLPWGRCTVKSNGGTTTLFLHVFDWPRDARLVVPGLGGAVARASLLADPAVQLAVDTTDDGVVIAVPVQEPDATATVVALELPGAPIVYRRPVITAESEQFVRSVDVTLANGSPAVAVHFTLDGSEPTAASPRCEAPLRLSATCTVKAASFHGDQRKSEVVERTFTKVDVVPPVKAIAKSPGLVVEQFAVDWSAIPDDRGALLPRAQHFVGSVGPLDKPGEHVAFVYRGFVVAPTDELYRFALSSDDGSKLWIDGTLVVDNDGLHGAVEKRGAIGLAKGLHAIEVVWFNKTGGAELSLKWALPGQPFTALTQDVLRH
ncbi:MAG: alpha-L-fucosidase [Planctomycetota bacterium]